MSMKDLEKIRMQHELWLNELHRAIADGDTKRQEACEMMIQQLEKMYWTIESLMQEDEEEETPTKSGKWKSYYDHDEEEYKPVKRKLSDIPYTEWKLVELKEEAKRLCVHGYSTMKKAELIELFVNGVAPQPKQKKISKQQFEEEWQDA